jgi:hypothetical protein
MNLLRNERLFGSFRTRTDSYHSEGDLAWQIIKIVSTAAWIEARKQLLTEEKEFNRMRDRLAERRREMPC